MAFLTKPGILALLRNRLRLNDVTLSMSSLLVVLRDLSAWFSIFDTAHLTDLGSKTKYHRLTSLKISNNLLIHHGGVAQWLGRRISDQGVPGSNPGRCTFLWFKHLFLV